MVSAELWPLASAGGLAEMVAALARALVAEGHEVRCALPRYPAAVAALPPGARTEGEHELEIALGGRREPVRLTLVDADDLPASVLLVGHPVFDRAGIYDDPATRQGYPDNAYRWALLGRALHTGLGATGFAPDVVHGHDHQAAPLLAMLRWSGAPPGLARRPATVFTIHNLEYQGQEDPAWLAYAGLPLELHRPLGPAEFHGRVNLMKLGILAADRLTTVSPRYAAEIQAAEFGAGLDRVLAGRAGHLRGILNGIDTTRWNPEIDRHIPFRYTSASFEGKAANRTALERELGLPGSDGEVPLLGFVGRLTSQKGLDLLLAVLDAVLGEGIPMAILGSGERRYESALADAARRHPALAVRLGFDEPLAHRIEAGADAFLMPSRYEPCGLNQMYSLRYGTIPIVRAVGGLADTVVDLDEDPPRANGFVFRLYEPVELLKTIRRAVRAWRDRELWTAMARRGMAAQLDWHTAARRYLEVYRESLAAAGTAAA